MLLESIASVASIGDYVAEVQQNRTIDVQPVRDLSYLFDIKVARLLHLRVPPFHITQLVIWSICLWLVLELLLINELSVSGIIVGLSVIACHPIVTNSVGWIAARKHLLAFLFILLATRSVLLRKSRKLTFCYYMLAMLSHPLFVLWPIWVYFADRASGAEVFRVVDWLKKRVELVVGMLTVAALNQWYYSTRYIDHTGIRKEVADATIRLLAPALALGRDFVQLFAPIWLSAEYSPWSWQNFAGLIILLVCVVIGARRLFIFRSQNRETLWQSRGFIWSTFACLVLAPVTLVATNVFVSDTYLLAPLVAMGLGLAWLWPRFSAHRFARPVVVIVIACCCWLSYGNARTWVSDEALWANAYRHEFTRLTVAHRAQWLIKQNMFDEAERTLARFPGRVDDPILTQVRAKLVFQRSDLNSQVKREQLLAMAPRAWPSYYLAVIAAQEKNFLAASNQIWPALTTSPDLFGNDLSVIAAEAYYFCVRSAAQSPDDRKCRSNLEQMFLLVETNAARFQWQPVAFEMRLRALGIEIKTRSQ